MIELRYYVFHKIQIGKGNITEAGRVVTRILPIRNADDINGVCNALAQSHKVQDNHVMICSWQYLGWNFAVGKTLKAWAIKLMSMVTGQQ